MTKQKTTRTTKKKLTKKTKTTKKSSKKETNLHAILRRKRILCHTCKLKDKCADALAKTYPYICMIYEAQEK